MTDTDNVLDAVIQGNPGAWLEGFTKIKLVNGKKEKPRLNILQRRIIALHRARRARQKPVRGIGLKPRKRGFSTGVSAIHYTELQKNSYEGVIVGNKLETSDTVYRMMEVYCQEDDILKEERWGSSARWTNDKAEFPHGSILSQSTAKNGESIRGQTPNFVHGTEVAHWEDDSRVLLALLNAVPDDPSSSVWLESTPNGNTNEFAKTWSTARWPTADECPDGVKYWEYFAADCPDNPDAHGDDQGFVRVFAAWFEFEEAHYKLTDDEKAKVRDTLDAKSWYEGEKELIARFGNIRASDGAQRLGIEVEGCDVWEQLAWRRSVIKNKCNHDRKKFDQEYPRDPTSCFLASGSPVFDQEAVAEYKNAAELAAVELGTIEINRDKSRATWRRCPDDQAIFKRWEEPSAGRAYLITVDPAVGEDQTKGDDPDRHSVGVWRRGYVDTNGNTWKPRLVARVKPPCRVPIRSLVDYAEMLCIYYGRAVIIPEMNNSGLAFIVLAVERNLPIWKRQEYDPKSGKKQERLGWQTTDTADYGGVRTLIIEKLAAWLRDRSVVIECPDVCHELGSFVRKPDKKGRMEASDNEHDDDVLMSAMAAENMDQATAFEEPTVARVLPKDLREHESLGEVGLAMRS